MDTLNFSGEVLDVVIPGIMFLLGGGCVLWLVWRIIRKNLNW